ncbi:uncharacterized protein PRCAT00003346001 [Priceomyces carsonii]|uniref:uncharacterized protein n=1 Tax=Priceomyces carsonii TaxID=28549 RepID=UPI002EDB0F8A|nr:unnamed protein product [Priceomyces carsonii]
MEAAKQSKRFHLGPISSSYLNVKSDPVEHARLTVAIEAEMGVTRVLNQSFRTEISLIFAILSYLD